MIYVQLEPETVRRTETTNLMDFNNNKFVLIKELGTGQIGGKAPILYVLYLITNKNLQNRKYRHDPK